MKKNIQICGKVLFFLTIACCGIYPFLVWLTGQAFFKPIVEGDFLFFESRVVGAKLLAQKFTHEKYFWSRPSFAGSEGYDASNSAGSNLGPTQKALLETFKKNLNFIKTKNVENTSQKFIPFQLWTSSASGLDPHLSPEAALYQAPRVAKKRGLSIKVLQKLIAELTQKPSVFLASPEIVSVLELNLELDKRYSARPIELQK